MVESVGNEVLVSAEREPMLRGTGNEVSAMYDEVRGDELAVNTEGKDIIENYREVNQSLKVEPIRLDAMVSDKSAVTVDSETGNMCREDMLKDKSEACQLNSVHNQDKNATVSIEASDVQDMKDNNAPNETLSHVKIKAADSLTGHEIESNGKVLSGDFQLVGVDAANLLDESKLIPDMSTGGQVLETRDRLVDAKVDVDFSVAQQGSTEIAIGESISETVLGHEPDGSSLSANTKFDSASSYAVIVEPGTNQKNDVDVQGVADTSFAAEVLDEVDGCVPLCDGNSDEHGVEKNKGSGEYIQSCVGDGVKSQEQDKHVFSCFYESPAAANSYNEDGNAGIGLNLECSKVFCEQTNESVSSEPQDSSEAAEPIRSYVPSGVQVQKYANGSEIVDSLPQDGEEGSVFGVDRSGNANDVGNIELDGMIDVSLNEGSGDPPDINMYGEENMGNELLDDGWESHSREEELVHGAGISQDEDEDDNAGCSSSRSETLIKGYRASYDLPPENSDEISVSDLVWGKVKSHPWWPGQIFNPSDSSEKAKKYYRKDCYLVAYFGDRSFAWNYASQLRPFRKHFSLEENQSSSESFQNAVNCALEEVQRRIEVGLACSCLPHDTYEKIRFQTVQNAGINKEASRSVGGDGSASLDSFHPDKLVRFVRRLAQFPTCGANRLELVTAKAHLSSFYHLKGYYPLPEFQFHGGLLEDNVDTSFPQESTIEKADSVAMDGVSGALRGKGALKRKHNLKDIVYHRRKEKSFSEIMGDSMFYYDEDDESDEKHDDLIGSSTVGRKRKASFVADDFIVQDSPKSISLAKLSQTVNPTPRQSFKIGDCIRRVAIQLTGAPSSSAGSPSTPKGIDVEHDKPHFDNNLNDSFQTVEETKTEEMDVVAEESSPHQLLVQLQLTACVPRKVYCFSKPIICFFSEYRDSVASARHSGKENSSLKKGVVGRKRKTALAACGLSEAFEFEEKGDSYWTDMVVQHDSAEKPERRGRKRKNQHQDIADQHEKPVKIKRKYTKKQHNQGNNDEVLPAEKFCEVAKIKEQLDTELILSFTDIAYLPSETNLNKMLKRFGPLKESETRVVRDSSHARVIFKRGSDAEVAYSSVAAFGIFGPSSAVSYQLNYTPSLQSESQPFALTNHAEGAI